MRSRKIKALVLALMSTDQLNSQKSDRKKESSPCMLCACILIFLCSMRSLKNREKTKTTEEIIHSLLMLLLFFFVFFVKFWVFFIRTFWMVFLSLSHSRRQVIIMLHSIDLPATNLLNLLFSLCIWFYSLVSYSLALFFSPFRKLRPISIKRQRITENRIDTEIKREGAKERERERFGKRNRTIIIFFSSLIFLIRSPILSSLYRVVIKRTDHTLRTVYYAYIVHIIQTPSPNLQSERERTSIIASLNSICNTIIIYLLLFIRFTLCFFSAFSCCLFCFWVLGYFVFWLGLLTTIDSMSDVSTR